MSIGSYFNPKDGLLNPEGSLSKCLPMQAIALANKVVEKAIMDKALDKKHVQYFIYCIARKFGGDLNLAVWRSGLKPSN